MAVNKRAQALSAAMQQELGRRHLLDFTRLIYPGWLDAPHLTLIAELFERIERGELNRCIVSVQPGSGKSTLLQLAAAWYLGRHPERRIISCSAAERLVIRNSRAVRDLFRQSEWPWENVKLAADVTASGVWETSAGGGMFAVGVDGVVTGWRGSLIICDDLQDGPGSKLERDNLEDWMRGKLLTRLEPGGAVIVIQTRWNRDDLPGRLLGGSRGDAWEYVRIPALSEGDGDPLGRPEGAALWPARFSVEMLEEIRADIGGKHFASQYQCCPVIDGGEVFRLDDFGRYNPSDLPRDEHGVPRTSKIVCALDAAAKTGIRNDYSVVVTIGEHGGKFYVLDCRREKVEYPALKRMVLAMYEKWRPARFYMEDTSSATALAQQLQVESSLPIKTVKVTASKEARAESVSGLVEAGRVFLPTEARWLAEFEDDLGGFPSAAHDDCTDSFCLALSQLHARARSFSFSWGDAGASAIEGATPDETEEWRSFCRERDAMERADAIAAGEYVGKPEDYGAANPVAGKRVNFTPS
jgi:predicted phage terminase large subunit-like protein